MCTQYVAGEPPERTAARARRLAETQQKMAAASAEMAARDAAADQEKSDKVDLREQLKPRMEAWHKGKQVRGDGGAVWGVHEGAIRHWVLQPYVPSFFWGTC